jgi:hypothetical protein
MLCCRMSAAALLLSCAFLFTGCCSSHSACNPLAPRAITHSGYRASPELLALSGAPIERGRPRRFIDGVGWVLGIPGRVLLWDPRIDNHRISHHTEAALASYLHDNELHHVKARLNQYAPLEDWRRLRANKTVGWGYRYTLGTLSILGEAIFPGRIFGGDHYNPFTATVHLYSDVPAIALHEAAHAKDFSRRSYPGTYALAYMVPGVPLWHERIATGDVLAYTETSGDSDLRREAYRLLYPAYGTYVGGAMGVALPRYADPLYYGSVLVGHAFAHEHAYAIEEPPLGNLGGDRRWLETMPDLTGAVGGDEPDAVPGDVAAAVELGIDDDDAADLPLSPPQPSPAPAAADAQ